MFFAVESEVTLEFAGLAELLDTVPASVVGGLPVPQRQESARRPFPPGPRNSQRSCAGLAFATFLHGCTPRQDQISRALAGAEQSATLSMELRPNVAVGHILHWTNDLDGAPILYQQ